MVNLSIQADLSEVHAALKELGPEIPKINKKILKTVAAAAKRKVSVSVRSNLNTKRPRGKEGVGIVQRIFSSVKREDYAYVGVGWKYAFILEHGATITARDSKYLTFKTDNGKWIKTPSVTIPAKAYFFPTVTKFVEGSEYLGAIEKLLYRELKKLGWE